MKICRSLFTALLFVVSIAAQSQVPRTIAYQGILMQSDGITPVTDGSSWQNNDQMIKFAVTIRK